MLLMSLCIKVYHQTISISTTLHVPDKQQCHVHLSV